ncbi:glycosyltransferase family 2 protein, partial [Bacteroides caecigallinarum]|uniref:glycosyltransferase family 2 protein n=1 Tax=Bacteroides caecigallinarum TaxID=1411144 RepID=UPI001F386328
MDKLVSVIIPTYSRPTNLKRAIDSVLNQTYDNIELIVVDDNGLGTENQIKTEKVIHEYLSLKNFHYLKHETNKNGAAARNTGIKNSDGVYIAFLDDDDEFTPNKIAIQVKALEQLDNTWGGCYCNMLFKGRREKITNNKKSGNLLEEMLLETARFNSSTLLFRKEVCIDLKGFDESYTRHQDWEFMIRFFRKYKIFLPPETCIVNRFFSFEHNNIPKSESFINIKKKFLEEFKDDIDKCKNKNTIYHKQLMQVAYSLFVERKYKLFYS